MSDERCERCRFWEKIFKQDDPNSDDGRCRRYPPVLNSIQLADDVWNAMRGEQEDWVQVERVPYYWTQPITESDTWCGEFQPSEPEVGRA